MNTPPLIAVVGLVEPDLLTAFVTHYRTLGVTRFLLAFHFPGGTDPDRVEALLTRQRALLGPPALVSRGPWHEHTNTTLRDRLRQEAGHGWHLLADIDEFQTWPASLEDSLTAAQAAGAGVVGGLMLDRIAADGRLPPWTLAQGLDRAYPLGGFLTHLLLHGDPRKIVAARADIPIASGNHRAPDHKSANQPPVMIHHFKWRHGVLPYLRQRARLLGRTWQEQTPAIRQEAARLLAHVAAHGGRIDVHSPALPLRPVGLTELPAWWQDEARHLVDTWHPNHQPADHRDRDPG